MNPRYPRFAAPLAALMAAAFASGCSQDAGGDADAACSSSCAGDGGAADAGAVDATTATADAAPCDDDPALCRCDAYPASCAAAAPTTATEHQMTALEACAFGLRRSGDTADAEQIFDEVAAVAGGYTPLATVLENLNRSAIESITSGNANRLRNHDYLGFQWNAGDNATPDWYPQGVTGGSDVQADGRPEGRRLLLVSWYDHTGNNPAKGVRVSLVDLTNTDDITYRHLLLVIPVRSGGTATFTALNYGSGNPVHAGGIVWVGNLLYVATTGSGFRVFDMTRIVEATHTDDNARIGSDGTRIDGHGYRYLVPQIASYVTPSDACEVRFSFAGLDRSATPPVIVSGEYNSSEPIGRLVSWPIDLSTGWLDEQASGDVRGIDAVVGAQTRMQGGLSYQGNYYISSSSQIAGGYGRLYRTRPGLTSSISAWIYGAEDLYMERDTNRIWTAGEHPDNRDTVSIHRLDP